MTYIHAGHFESSHEKFKSAYQLTSKRSKSVVMEVIERENRRATYGHLMQVWPKILCKANSFKPKAIKTDGAYLSETGLTTMLQDIMSVYGSQEDGLAEIETASEDTSVSEKLHFRLKSDGLWSLLRLLRK